ncbi:MAG: hypothetical protein V9G19_14870 [Tetrasphaera sp.]
MTAITAPRLLPTTDTNTMINSSGGIDRMMSVNRISTWSAMPPKAPAMSPTAVPMVTNTTTAPRPAMSDTRVPCTTRAKMSRPDRSPPRMWLALGGMPRLS